MISRITGWLIVFVIGTDLFVVSPLLPDISGAVGLTATTSGATVSVFSLAYLVGGPLFGSLADRHGRTRVLTITLGAFTLANVLTALSPDAAVLLVSRTLAGLAAAGVTPSVYALVGAAAPDGRRATWLAVVTSGLLLALATGAPLGSILAPAIGWRGVFVALAVGTAVLTLVLVVKARRVPDEASSASTDGRMPSATDAAGMPARLLSVLPTALWALSVYGLYTYLGSILTGRLQASTAVVAITLVCYGLGAVAGNLAGGRLADGLGARATSVASLGLLAVAMVAIGITVRVGVGALIPVLLVLSAVAYPFFSAQQARLAGLFPASSGRMLAWNNSAMYAGILLGSALGGAVLDRVGPSVLAWACAVVGLAGAVAAAVGSSSTSAGNSVRPSDRHDTVARTAAQSDPTR